MTKENYTGEDGLLYCGTCNEALEEYFPVDKVEFFGRDRHPRMCLCARERHALQEKKKEIEEHKQNVAKLRRECFQYGNYDTVTFERSKRKNDQMVKCQNYVAAWDKMKSQNIGLLLWGDIGTGKTYFAACIANALLEKEVSVRMLNFSHILNTGFEGRNDLIASACRCSLLIIDDFGSERATEFGLEIIHSVLDARYSCGKPMIVTTNLPLMTIHNPADVMHKKIYDRLQNCVPIKFVGESIRKEIGSQKMEEFRQTLLNAQDSF